MSPSWLERLQPMLQRVREAWVRDSHTLRVGPRGIAVDGGAAPSHECWPARVAPEVDALRVALDAATGTIRPGARISVVVADAWCRTLFPDFPAGLRHSERRAFVQQGFFEIYGAQSDDWTIHAPAPLPGDPPIAVAIDRALHDTLHAELRARRLRLTSLKPEWVTLATRHRRQLSGGGGALLNVDGGVASLAVWRDDAWRWHRVQVVGEQADAGWHGLFNAGLPALPEGTAARVHCVGVRPPEMPRLPAGWSLTLLDEAVA